MLNKKANFEIVDLNFKKFQSLPGSQHIASRSSQLNLLEISKKLVPKKILDYGAGIGTLTKLMLDATHAKIWAVEKNNWCKNQFFMNIEVSDRVEFCQAIPYSSDFDLIIIDDEIKFNEIYLLIKNTTGNFSVFIEGWRNLTVAKFSFALLILAKSANYKRGACRLNEWNDVDTLEKSGSNFFANPTSFPSALKSWLKRINLTDELSEYRYWIFRKTFIFNLLKFLNIQNRLRRLFGFNQKKRIKNWRTKTAKK
jgi:hypothetical protein